jgi:predicted aspartyl protease
MDAVTIPARARPMAEVPMLLTSLAFLLFGVVDSKPMPIVTDVHIGAHGPYRFLVDTGAETSFIDPRLAATLGLEPTFRTEIITQHGARPAPGLNLASLRLGPHLRADTEVILHDVSEARRLDPSVRGLLGFNALAGLNFALHPARGQIDFTAARPQGEVVPLFIEENRIAVQARMGGENLKMLLDSGATHIVLFGTPAAMAKTPPVQAMFTTFEGARSVIPTVWTAELRFGDKIRVGTLPAAIVDRKGSEASGLLPISIFKMIYVDQAKRELVLIR